MNDPKHQPWPDGARVRFTDEAREAMQKRPGTAKPLRTPGRGPDAVYTIDNTDDVLRDVVLRETGERYGTYWLQRLAELDEAWGLRGSREEWTGSVRAVHALGHGTERRPVLQSVDQLRGLAGKAIVLRMRAVERLLEMRRLGWAEAHPPIVTICGSTRFREQMREADRELTLAGCMVLAPGVFAHDGDEITDEQKTALDELHLRKIDLADQVLVVDPGGYVGESTWREIAYARKRRTPVAYLSEQEPPPEKCS